MFALPRYLFLSASLGLLLACSPTTVVNAPQSQPTADTSAQNPSPTEPMNGSDNAIICESFEVFDATEQACVLNCDSEAACDQLEAQIDASFDQVEQDFLKTDRPASSAVRPTTSIELSGKEFPTLRYAVAAGQLGDLSQDLKGRDDLPAAFQANANHQQIWKLYQDISTTSLLNDVTTFDLVYEDNGQGNLAQVAPIENNNKQWLVEANLAELIKPEQDTLDISTLRHTMIHEFAHILTLHDNQVDGSVSQENCPRFYLQEGCSRENAYIKSYFERFWQAQFAENERIQALEGDEKTSAQDAFYAQHRTDFLTAYAATNPAEDIAESFTAFVIRKDKPAGSTVADQKVAFFYDFPELLTLRTQIRQRIVFQTADFQTQLFSQMHFH